MIFTGAIISGSLCSDHDHSTRLRAGNVTRKEVKEQNKWETIGMG